MASQGITVSPEIEKSKLNRTIYISIGLHILGLVFMVIYPYLFKKEPVEVPVLTLVPLEKPKVRLLKPKKPKPEVIPEEEPIKKEAPKLTEKPKEVTPEKKVEVKKEPDTTKKVIKQIIEEVVEEMVPQMVMDESADPRLKFWARRVQKKVQSQWNPPGGIGILGTATITVKFTVKRSGEVSDIGIFTSSGNASLDDIGKNTIERVGNLPPIPPNFQEKDELNVNIIFKYRGD